MPMSNDYTMALGELTTSKLTSSDFFQNGAESADGTCTKSFCHIDGTDDGDEATLL